MTWDKAIPAIPKGNHSLWQGIPSFLPVSRTSPALCKQHSEIHGSVRLESPGPGCKSKHSGTSQIIPHVSRVLPTWRDPIPRNIYGLLTTTSIGRPSFPNSISHTQTKGAWDELPGKIRSFGKALGFPALWKGQHIPAFRRKQPHGMRQPD